MGCRKCGGTPPSTSPAQQLELQATGDMVLMEYIGIQTQKQRLRSKVKPQDSYIFGGGQTKFLAYRGDVVWLTAMANRFREAPRSAISASVDVANVPVLASDTKPIAPPQPVLTDLPIDALTLDHITLALLKRKFSTVNEVRNAGKAEWLLIDGIGNGRAEHIEEALKALKI